MYSLVSKVSSMLTFLPVWNGHFTSLALQLVTEMLVSLPNFASAGHGVNSVQLASANKLSEAMIKVSSFEDDILNVAVDGLDGKRCFLSERRSKILRIAIGKQNDR